MTKKHVWEIETFKRNTLDRAEKVFRVAAEKQVLYERACRFTAYLLDAIHHQQAGRRWWTRILKTRQDGQMTEEDIQDFWEYMEDAVGEEHIIKDKNGRNYLSAGKNLLYQLGPRFGLPHLPGDFHTGAAIVWDKLLESL